MPNLVTRRTRVVLLQHPKESRTGIGTAKMAHLSLPGSVLRAALDFTEDRVVAPILRGPPQPYVLFPGPDAVRPEDLPPDQPLSLIVLDGTWWQAAKLLKLNPALQSLPKLGFVPRMPSAYEIRKQPADHCVSTIEALAEVLQLLEPDGPDFEQLRRPFAEMVRRQLRFETDVANNRHGHRKKRRTRKDGLPERIRDCWANLVVVHAESNVWPAQATKKPPAEILHWTATRVASGETFHRVVKPQQPLAPNISHYSRLPMDRILAGGDASQVQNDWQQFTRSGDVVCTYGFFHLNIARTQGWILPENCFDLRNLLSQHLRKRLGTPELAHAHLDLPPHPNGDESPRAEHRIKLLVDLVGAMKKRAVAPPDAP